ncbi:MAG: hypothetical protein GVY14_16130, partial [Spirochaetes bacterium]|nr:hypothetical protein [Spirochaetota bacterium]
MPRFRKENAEYAAGLRRPEIVWHEASGRAPGGPGGRRSRRARDGGTGAGTGAGGHKGLGRDAEHRWSLLDIGAMILAALQVILPFVLILLAAVAAAYGLFMLAFGP